MGKCSKDQNRCLPLPVEAGSYVLLCQLLSPVRLTVGRLGDYALERGVYLYVGSAHGPGGLAARVGRHARPHKTRRWHVDYLRQRAALVGVWWGLGDDGHRQCPWAAALATLAGVTLGPRGFGASDCRCPGHLFHAATPPRGADFAAALAALGRAGPVYAIAVDGHCPG